MNDTDYTPISFALAQRRKEGDWLIQLTGVSPDAEEPDDHLYFKAANLEIAGRIAHAVYEVEIGVHGVHASARVPVWTDPDPRKPGVAMEGFLCVSERLPRYDVRSIAGAAYSFQTEMYAAYEVGDCIEVARGHLHVTAKDEKGVTIAYLPAPPCTCVYEDIGGPESGPKLHVDRDPDCPQHGRVADPDEWVGYEDVPDDESVPF